MDLNMLRQQLQEWANLSPEQAEKAAQVALDFFSNQVPQVAGLIDKAGGAESLAQRLSGMLGKRD